MLSEMERYAGVSMDYVLMNNKCPPEDLLDWYKKSSNVEPIEDDLKKKSDAKSRIVRLDLLSETKYEQSIADRIRRSLIRHDPDKVSKAIIDIVNAVF